MSRRKVAGKRLTVVFELGEQSGWVASVKEVPGCHTQGRSVRHARTRIREALSLWIGDRSAGVAEFEEHFPLPPNVRRMLRRLAELEAQLDGLREVESTVAALRRRAVCCLVGEEGFSYRDAAEVLGISHSRVEQLLKSRS